MYKVHPVKKYTVLETITTSLGREKRTLIEYADGTQDTKWLLEYGFATLERDMVIWK